MNKWSWAVGTVGMSTTEWPTPLTTTKSNADTTAIVLHHLVLRMVAAYIACCRLSNTGIQKTFSRRVYGGYTDFEVRGIARIPSLILRSRDHSAGSARRASRVGHSGRDKRPKNGQIRRLYQFLFQVMTARHGQMVTKNQSKDDRLSKVIHHGQQVGDVNKEAASLADNAI